MKKTNFALKKTEWERPNLDCVVRKGRWHVQDGKPGTVHMERGTYAEGQEHPGTSQKEGSGVRRAGGDWGGGQASCGSVCSVQGEATERFLNWRVTWSDFHFKEIS